MRDLDEKDRGPVQGDVSSRGWWYRFWDLHTEQFTLFTKGLLDPAVYELWMAELATVYNDAPADDVETRAVAHAAYLDKTLPQHVSLHSFFRELSGISADHDPTSRAAQVRTLVNAYAPSPVSPAQRAVRVLRGRGRVPDHEVLVSEEAIRRRVRELARVIGRRYAGKPVLIVAIMKSAEVLAKDLARLIPGELELATIEASSYGGGTEAKPVAVGDASVLNVADRDVLIVDDIIETGKTLEAVRAEIYRFSPRSVAICVLLSKPGRLSPDVDVAPNYVGFGSIPDDKFVVGYGIDHDGNYRELPYISAVDESGRLLPAFAA